LPNNTAGWVSNLRESPAFRAGSNQNFDMTDSCEGNEAVARTSRHRYPSTTL